MKARVYFDITLRHDPEIPIWDRIGRAWRILHVAASKAGVAFAIGFPKWMSDGFTLGDTIRVFVENREHADCICDDLEHARGFGDIATVSRTRTVNGVGGENLAFEAYVMHRIPSGISKPKKDGVPQEVKQRLQDENKRRRLAQQQHLPFIRMRSSSGARFRLVIERIMADESQSGVPNSYGLSRRSQIVALPII